MKRDEFAIFAMALKTFYPNDKLLPNQKAADLWFGMLEDVSYDVASAALRSWVAVNKWPPTIADIREAAHDVTSGDPKEWSEAWEQVMIAVRKYGFYQVDVALASFDDLTRTCVERIGFRNICMSENESIERANFRMIYERALDRKRRNEQIPPDVRLSIESVRNRGEIAAHSSEMIEG